MKRWLVGIFLALAISGVFYWQSANSPTDIPPLFPQVVWEEFIETKEGYESLGELGLYSLYLFESISMSGKEWIASKNDIDRDAMDKLLESFRSYYDGELTKLGWNNTYEDAEDARYNFIPSSASGPGGEIWGYVKVRDGKLREVLLQKITPIEDFGGRAVCPCNVTFRVFVSGVVSLEDLIKRVEE